jgi:hypothetical protein
VWALEIAEFGGLHLDDALARLEAELEDFLEGLSRADVGTLLWDRMQRSSRHMNTWISTVRIFKS